MICEATDYIFPMQADVYYPVVEQGAYGNVKKQWILNKTIAGNFETPGSAFKQELTPNVNITQESLLLARVKSDIRISSRYERNSMTNIIVTNIRDRNCNEIYLETSGTRSGKPTIFEVATNEPFVGPFGGIEYYKLVLRRSENQAVDL
jgi:hypothetical protein